MAGKSGYEDASASIRRACLLHMGLLARTLPHLRPQTGKRRNCLTVNSALPNGPEQATDFSIEFSRGHRTEDVMRHLCIVATASAALIAAGTFHVHAGAGGPPAYEPLPYGHGSSPDDGPHPGYDEPSFDYGPPPYAYGLPPGYGPLPQYGPPPAYVPPPYAYRLPPGYGPHPRYGVPPPGYGRPPPYAHGAPPAYGWRPGYGPPPPGYGRSLPYAHPLPFDYGPRRDHGAPPRIYEPPPPAIPHSQPGPDPRRAI